MPISEKVLFDARTAWGNGLIEISKTFETEGIEMARKVAGKMLDTLYGYDLGQVLFKPTLSGGSQTFRPTKEGALSYYTGQNSIYPDDVGFGVKPWCEFSSNTNLKDHLVTPIYSSVISSKPIWLWPPSSITEPLSLGGAT